jgi:hypothetical protein
MRWIHLLFVLPVLLYCGCNGGSGGSGGSPGQTSSAPDFAIYGLTPGDLGVVMPGSTQTAGLTITPINGFSEAVTLGLLNPPAGFTGTGQIAAGAVSGTLTIGVPAVVAAGKCNLTIQAIGGDVVRTAGITLTIVPGYSITAPATASVRSGGDCAFLATPVDFDGFAGTVELGAEVTGPAQPILCAAQAVVLPGQAGPVVFDFDLAPGATTGLVLPFTGMVTVKGVSSGISNQAATFPLTITAAGSPDFQFLASGSTTSLTLAAGTSGAATFGWTPINGFAGPISIALAGVVSHGQVAALGGFTAASIQTAGSAGSGTTAINVADKTPAGSYSLIFLGTDGTYSHAQTIVVIVD